MDVTSKTWSIDIAIKVVQRVTALGFDGLHIYGMISEPEDLIEESCSKEHETYEDVIDRVSSACWTGMDYFKMWLQDDCLKLDFKNTRITDLNNIRFEKEGVYYVEFAGNESHYFIWIIKGESIWYVGTYGGVCEITVKQFDRKDYRRRFIIAMQGSMEDYAYVFDIDPVVNKVNFDWIAITKSNRYI